MDRMMLQNQKGRSLMEMMGVLCIMGVLSVGGAVGYTKMMSQYKVNKAIQQVGEISAKLSQLGAQTGSYEGLGNKQAYKFGAVPSSTLASADGSSLENPFGGNIEIKATSLMREQGDNAAYLVIYRNIPEDACVALASYGWSSNQASSFIGVGAGAGTSEASITSGLYQDCTHSSDAATYAVACGKNVPMNPGTATTACSCSSDSCVVVWMYF